MKAATTFCPRYGAKITVDATWEVCPACLLTTGISLLEEESVAGTVNAGCLGGLASVDEKKATRSATILRRVGNYDSLEKIGRAGGSVVYRKHPKVSIAPSDSKF
jgi:hypothetical protein